MNIENPKCNLNIDETVTSIFLKYVQLNPNSFESGGILTGKIYDESIEILNCSEPTKLDNRQKYNFNRSCKSAQVFINKRFDMSKGEEIYLGEWHTHPEDIPTPSQLDIKSFSKTISKNILNSCIHFMIIIGRVENYIGIYENGEKIFNTTFKTTK